MIFETIKRSLIRAKMLKLINLTQSNLKYQRITILLTVQCIGYSIKNQYTKENFSKEFNQILEEYAEYGAKESAFSAIRRA